MYEGVTVLDFDHSYQWQSFLNEQAVEWIDLSDLPGTTRYCSLETLAVIRRRLGRRRRRGVTLIGSGSYHYVTYLLLAEIETPFSLVLFDYHTDMIESPDESLITCGSWVLKALAELPMLKQVVIVGARSDGAKAIPPAFGPELRRKVSIFGPVTGENAKIILPAVMSRLTTRDVYISVDKDVLDPADAVTDWEQGSMKLDVVTELIRFIASRRTLRGADICGEYPVSPVERYSPAHRAAARINQRANRLLLEAFRSADRSWLPLTS